MLQRGGNFLPVVPDEERRALCQTSQFSIFITSNSFTGSFPWGDGYRKRKEFLYQAFHRYEVQIETTWMSTTNTEVLAERTKRHSKTAAFAKGKERTAQIGKVFPEIKCASR